MGRSLRLLGCLAALLLASDAAPAHGRRSIKGDDHQGQQHRAHVHHQPGMRHDARVHHHPVHARAPRVILVPAPVYVPVPAYPQYHLPRYAPRQYYVPPVTPAPEYPLPRTTPQVYYYCRDLGEYYPAVSDCPSPWLSVLPHERETLPQGLQ